MDDQAAREVVAMQFAGGRSIAQLAEEWERDQAWVEEAIRQALLEEIPERDGGLKVPRGRMRAERAEESEATRKAQGALFT
jgi:uncharacterized protein YbbK (DUF523 family)